MKFFRRKTSILDIVLVIGVFVSFYLGKFLEFTFLQKIFVGVVFLLGILVIAFFPRQKNEEDIIAENDERNQYIALRSAYETAKAISYTCFLSILGSLICFGLTEESAFIWILIGIGIPYGVLKVSTIVCGIKYDK